jgi:hypothetical protein
MIWNVAYVVGSAVGSGGAARPGAEGIVSRPRLVGQLGASARVTMVSAPPGSGKTVPLRSWISQAGAATVQGLLRAGRPAVGGVRSRSLSHSPRAWVGRSANIPVGRGASRLPSGSRHVESAQHTIQLQTDIVAPGAFMVQIRRPATDEDQ